KLDTVSNNLSNKYRFAFVIFVCSGLYPSLDPYLITFSLVVCQTFSATLEHHTIDKISFLSVLCLKITVNRHREITYPNTRLRILEFWVLCQTSYQHYSIYAHNLIPPNI